MSAILFLTGNRYPLLNLVTQETANFELLVIGEHRSKHIFYGETSRHGITIKDGVRQEVKARASCFAFMGQEDAAVVLELVQQLAGVPVALVVGGSMGTIEGRTSVTAVAGADMYPVLNAGPLWGDADLERGYQQGFTGQSPMMRKCARLIDVWFYWTEHKKQLPSWCGTRRPEAAVDALYLPERARRNGRGR